MKLKDDILGKFEKGATIWEIADEYCTTPEAVAKLLGVEDRLQWKIEEEDAINEL